MKKQLYDMMCVSLGGRVAEQNFFGEMSTGASDDLEKVTKLAYDMTTIYGMSPKVGQLSYQKQGEGFSHRAYSESTAVTIDEEVRLLVDNALKATQKIVQEKRDLLEALALRLLDKEVLEYADVLSILGERPFVQEPDESTNYLRRSVSSSSAAAPSSSLEEKSESTSSSSLEENGGSSGSVPPSAPQ